MSKVLIVGGGAAGMYASIFAARNGHEVHVYEKNEKLGKKLFITGKGRCNLTNASDMEDLFLAVVTNAKFLYSSFYSHTNLDTMAVFEELGLSLKTERGNRVFPVSDHSSDVIATMTKEMKRLGVTIHLNTSIAEVVEKDGVFSHVIAEGKNEIYGDACIVASGGVSYPLTGSTGDGHKWAQTLGHQVKPLSPALVPIEVKEPWILELQGLSLKNVEITISDQKKELYKEFGEMLFTHYGVSGPLIISASSYVGGLLTQKELRLEIDLKPALTYEQLDQRVIREFKEHKNKQFKNAIGRLFPSKLLPVILGLTPIDSEKQVNTISKEERKTFVHLIKHFTMTLTAVRGFREAIITKGGINIKEIHPSTMESKKVKRLFFAGEILDLDALTGGFNLQIAWSTAYAAGNGI